MKKIILVFLLLFFFGTASASDITWSDKNTGDSVTAANMNEIKTAVNSKQDELAEGAFANGDKTKLDGIESGSLAPDDTAYNATSWDGDGDPPTKNAVRDKFESLSYEPADAAITKSDEAETITGAWDFGGATSLEMPNTAGDLTLDAAGEFGTDSTDEQFCFHDGTREVCVSSIQMWQMSFDPGNMYDSDAELWLVDLHADTYPNGIVLWRWSVRCNVADPDVEMDMDLMYCDDPGSGAFPGANPTLIDVMDTTTGNSSESTNTNMAGNGVVATGKTIYLLWGADPEGTCTQLHVRLHYYIPEN